MPIARCGGGHFSGHHWLSRRQVNVGILRCRCAGARRARRQGDHCRRCAKKPVFSFPAEHQHFLKDRGWHSGFSVAMYPIQHLLQRQLHYSARPCQNLTKPSVLPFAVMPAAAYGKPVPSETCILVSKMHPLSPPNHVGLNREVIPQSPVPSGS